MNGMLDAMDTIVLLNASTGRGQYSIEDLEDLHCFTVIDRDMLEQSILSLLRKGLFYVAPTKDGMDEIARLIKVEKEDADPIQETYEKMSVDCINVLSDIDGDDVAISEVEVRVVPWMESHSKLERVRKVMGEMQELGLATQTDDKMVLTDLGKNVRERIWDIEYDDDYFRMQRECRP